MLNGNAGTYVHDRPVFESATPDAWTKVLIGLSDQESAAFFPDRLGDALGRLLPNAERFARSDSSVEAWSRAVKDSGAAIVVGCWSTPPLPEDVKQLRYYCNVVGSVRGRVPRALIADGLLVTNWGNIAGRIVAEHALTMVLGLMRSIAQWPATVAGDWSQTGRDGMNCRSLFGRRVAIHGFGHVARELIRLLAPFGVDIKVYSAGVPAEVVNVSGVRQARSLKELAAWGDVFVTCEALNDLTLRTLNKDVLTALPHGCVFVNVGRGAVVDEDALADVALERGLRIGSDVFVQEPLPAASKLRSVPNALFSPHCAGPTPDVYPRCGELALANIERYLCGQPLEHQVTLDVYDRST